MAYLTTNDLENQFSASKLLIFAPNSDGSDYDTDKISSAIASADALANEYLSTRYSVPISTVSASMKRMLGYIVLYFIFDEGTEIPENYKKNYDTAIKYFQDIASGKISITGISAQSEGGMAALCDKTQSGRDFQRFSAWW